jgi:precorrin-6x reductase
MRTLLIGTGNASILAQQLEYYGVKTEVMSPPKYSAREISPITERRVFSFLAFHSLHETWQ